MMKAIALFVLAMMLVGCNTMEGLGKDIKKGGETLEKAATK
jgi:predicted small secreted protein